MQLAAESTGIYGSAKFVYVGLLVSMTLPAS